MYILVYIDTYREREGEEGGIEKERERERDLVRNHTD